MAQVHVEITDKLQAFVAQQHIFFVSTAPLSGEGHINLSPKGLDCFRVLSPHRVACVTRFYKGPKISNPASVPPL